MKMPAFVWYIIAAILPLGLGTCAVKKIQNDAVAVAKAKETVQVVLAENKRINGIVDTLRRSAKRDSIRADSAEKAADASQKLADAAQDDINAADSSATALVDTDNPENQDWQALYLAQLPRIEARDKKLADDVLTISSLRMSSQYWQSDAAKGWAAVDSLKKNNTDLVNKGIAAALALSECKIGPLPCPPRWAVALGTGLATLYVVKR